MRFIIFKYFIKILISTLIKNDSPISHTVKTAAECLSDWVDTQSGGFMA